MTSSLLALWLIYSVFLFFMWCFFIFSIIYLWHFVELIVFSISASASGFLVCTTYISAFLIHKLNFNCFFLCFLCCRKVSFTAFSVFFSNSVQSNSLFTVFFSYFIFSVFVLVFQYAFFLFPHIYSALDLTVSNIESLRKSHVIFRFISLHSFLIVCFLCSNTFSHIFMPRFLNWYVWIFRL